MAADDTLLVRHAQESDFLTATRGQPAWHQAECPVRVTFRWLHPEKLADLRKTGN